MAEYTNILVGIDGSEQSKVAFEKAVTVAKQNGATLHLVSVINGERYPSTGTLGYGFVDRGLYDDATKKMTATLAELKKRALAAGVQDVATVVKVGNAKVELTEGYPRDNQIDLIVIGVSGLNVIGRMVVGSTTAYVVRQAPCDVTVVKTDAKNVPLKIKRAAYPEI